MPAGPPQDLVPPFALDPSIDVRAVARLFAECGQVSIEPFLRQEQAQQLHRLLRSRTDWRQVINSGEKLFELDRATQASLTAQQRGALDEGVYAGARRGFQFRYETIRVPDEASVRTASDDVLCHFAAWLSQGAPRDLMRRIVGDADIAFADAQATAYSPGDFLTGHDDDVVGKHRVAAYVLGLNPEWRVEWGGLFLLHRDDGAEALLPGFNRLNLFRVPMMHSVSEVTRATPFRRYAITGWLRRG